MDDLFKYLISLLSISGELQKAHFYDGDFATLEYKKGNKILTISMRCEDAKDGNS